MPVYRGLTYEGYAEMEGVRSSDLKRLRESPLHYRYGKDDDTTSRGTLRAIHCLVLEPDTYPRCFATFDGTRRGKAYDDFTRDNEGKTILNAREAEEAANVAAAILRHAIAAELLAKATDRELTLTWNDPLTGLPCKARLDAWAPSIRTALDIKTYGTTDPRVVGRRVYQLGAHIQGAHYVEGARHALGQEDIDYLLIVAENKAPFDVGVFRLEPDHALSAGRMERDAMLGVLAECVATDRWPGRCGEIEALNLPAFAFGDDADDIITTDGDIHE